MVTSIGEVSCWSFRDDGDQLTRTINRTVKYGIYVYYHHTQIETELN